MSSVLTCLGVQPCQLPCQGSGHGFRHVVCLPQTEQTLRGGECDSWLGGQTPRRLLSFASLPAPLYFSVKIKYSCWMGLSCVLLYSVYCEAIFRTSIPVDFHRQNLLPWMPCTPAVPFGFCSDCAEPWGSWHCGSSLVQSLLWVHRKFTAGMPLPFCSQIFPAKVRVQRLSSLA